MPNAILTSHHVSTLLKEPDNSNRIRKAIELAGVTQRTVARAIDVPESYVSDIVRQRHAGIRVRTAAKLARFCGTTIETLFPSNM